MIQLTDNLEINKPAPVDDRLGVFESTAEALAYTNENRRYVGLTVIVDDGSGATEYWFKDGVTDADLEAKLTGGGGQVNSDWNATSGVAEILNKPTIPSIDGLVPYTGATEDVDLGTHDLYTNKVYLFDESNENHGSLHYTDGDFHIEDADGHKLLVIEDGFIQLHLTDTIQSNLFTSNLTQTRDHYLPNASGTIALTSDITKSAVGLGNVDNTSDANKPISTATQTALDLKAPIASPTFTGTVGGITKSMVGLGNVDNTADANKAFTASQITSGTFDKARLPKVIPAVAIAGSAFTSGNTTSEVIMSTLTIPANTLSVGDVVRISGLMTYTTAATKSLRVKFGTTIAGTAIYSPASLSASATSTQFELFAVVTGSTTLRFATNTVTGNTIYGNNTGALVNQTIDRTQPISFIVTVAKTSGADTVTCESAFLEIITS